MPGTSDRIAAGLRELHQALAEQRGEYERTAREQEARRATIVGAEGSLRSLTVASMRARTLRHLRPNEWIGPMRPPSDGEPLVTPVDARTVASLRLMGLSR